MFQSTYWNRFYWAPLLLKLSAFRFVKKGRLFFSKIRQTAHSLANKFLFLNNTDILLCQAFKTAFLLETFSSLQSICNCDTYFLCIWENLITDTIYHQKYLQSWLHHRLFPTFPVLVWYFLFLVSKNSKPLSSSNCLSFSDTFKDNLWRHAFFWEAKF